MRHPARKKVDAYIKESKLRNSHGDGRNKEDRYRKREYRKDRYKDDNGKPEKYTVLSKVHYKAVSTMIVVNISKMNLSARFTTRKKSMLIWILLLVFMLALLLNLSLFVTKCWLPMIHLK